jgi:hypothetical protein
MMLTINQYNLISVVQIGLGRTTLRCLKTKKKAVLPIAEITMEQFEQALLKMGSSLNGYGWDEYKQGWILSVSFINNSTINLQELKSILLN